MTIRSLYRVGGPWSQESAYSHQNFLTFNLIVLDLRILEESRTLWMP